MSLELARACTRALETFKDLDGADPTVAQVERLRGWAGWGPLAPALERGYFAEGSWADLRDQVKALLTKSEEQHAIAATTTAYYTTPNVVRAVWALLTRLGFNGGKVLEPGCGTGAFVGQAPPGMDVQFTGVEIDPVTAGIAKLLHPEANIINAPLERTPLKLGGYDAVVGNVPFSEVSPYDPAWPKTEFRLNLHNYFLWRAIQATRPGGLIALVTSRFTMDTKAFRARKFLSETAVFVGAIRLPTGMFDEYGTSVVADIVVLRRRTGDEGPNEEGVGAWERAADVDHLGTSVNDYWLHNPDMVLGALEPKGGAQYGQTLDVIPPAGADRSALLDRAVTVLVDDARSRGLTWDPEEVDPGIADADGEEDEEAGVEGAHTLHADGTVTRIEDGQPKKVRANAELKELLLLRDAAVDLFNAEGDPDSPDETLAPLRAHTRTLYEQYVGRFGYLNRSTVRQGPVDEETGLPTLTRSTPPLGGIRIDPDWPTLSAVEDWDDDTETGAPSQILQRRVNQRVVRKTSTGSPAEAVALVRDEMGRFDLARAAALLGDTTADAAVRLAGLIFQDPETLAWEAAEEYLSGDVRVKLKQARAASESDPGRWAGNVTALEEVQPEDLGPFEIVAKLSAPWVPARDVEGFIGHLLHVSPKTLSVKHEPFTATWEVAASEARGKPAATVTWGTSRVNAIDLIQMALNGAAPVVTDKVEVPDPANPGKYKEIRVRNNEETQLAEDRQQAIQLDFAVWLWSDPKRTDRLVRYYNDTYNARRRRVFDGKGYTYPGLASWFKPYDHQVDMVARIIGTKGATLCGYGVGAGKTAIMYLSALKMKELGQVRKPLIIVPNHLLEQVAGDGRRLYPGAKVLMVTKKDLTKDRRKAFAAKVASQDWDVIVMTHTQFQAISVSPGVEAGYLEDQILQYETAMFAMDDDDNRVVKRLGKQIMRMKARHAELMDARHDDGLFFDRLGIDFVFVDEAHFFKNLAAPTRMEGFSMPGSKRAQDLHMKVEWLRRRNPDGRCVALFTGTPVTNTLAEVFTLLRYLNPTLLLQKHLGSFDAFAGMFIVYKSKIEVSPDGSGFRMYRRPSEFTNVPELRMLLAENADIRSRKKLQLAGPKNIVHKLIQVEPPEELADIIDDLVARADRIRNGGVKPDEDNMLAVCGEGRAAALDVRLVGVTPSTPGKPEAVAREVATVYQTHRDRLYPSLADDGTLWMERPGAFQMVFCDLGTPNTVKGDQAYGWMRDEMVRLGVPRDQIRYIHEATSDAERKALFTQCRDGRISVLIASTEKAGTGVNVQHRMVAIHHVDCTWRPDGIEQRNGRGDRPGNSNTTLMIFQYVTLRSFDPYMWQGCERKMHFIDQAMDLDSNVRVIVAVPSEDEQYFAMIKAVSTGQERVMELEQAKAEVARMQNLATNHHRDQVRLKNQADQYQWSIQESHRMARTLLEIEEAARERPPALKLWNTTLDEQDDVLAELGKRARGVLSNKADERSIGEWRGVQVGLTQSWTRGKPAIAFTLTPPRSYHRIVPYGAVAEAHRKGNEMRLLTTIDAAISRAGQDAAREVERAEYLTTRLAEVKPMLGEPFAQQAELDAAEKVRDEIEAEIAQEMSRKEQPLKAAA